MCVFYKYWKRLLIKNKNTYCPLCIKYESKKYMLQIVFKKSSKDSSYQLQLKASYILLHFKLRWISVPSKTKTDKKCTCPTVLYFSFQLDTNNSITINRYEKIILLTACFKNGKISCTSFKFWWHNCNEALQANTDHSNVRVYCKQIDRRLKTSLIWGVWQLSTTRHSWVIESYLKLMIKRTHNFKKVLKNVLPKSNFSQSP